MAAKQHVYALFEDPEAALAAYQTVQDYGCSTERCTAVLHENHIDNSLDPVSELASREGAVRGALIGGLLGALLGGSAALIGGVVAVSPWAGALIGGGLLAGYGALAGGIAGADEPEEQLRTLEDEVSSGRIVITLETDDDELKKMCERVFKRYGGRLVVGN
jgi:alanine dehydrogenase